MSELSEVIENDQHFINSVVSLSGLLFVDWDGHSSLAPSLTCFNNGIKLTIDDEGTILARLLKVLPAGGGSRYAYDGMEAEVCGTVRLTDAGPSLFKVTACRVMHMEYDIAIIFQST